MKRVISIAALLLVAALLFTALTACGEKQNKEISAGTYALKSASGSSAEEFNAVKESLTLEVKEDGTATLLYAGVSAAELKFDKETGKVSFQGSEVPYESNGSKITIEDAGGKLVFEK